MVNKSGGQKSRCTVLLRAFAAVVVDVVAVVIFAVGAVVLGSVTVSPTAVLCCVYSCSKGCCECCRGNVFALCSVALNTIFIIILYLQP